MGAISWLALTAVLSAGTIQAPVPTPDLIGAWRLNKDLSDRTPADVSGANGPQGRPSPEGAGGMGGRGGRGGRRGMGRRGDGRDRTPSREDMQRMRVVRQLALEAPARLTIVRAEDSYLVTTDDGQVTRLKPDGKKVKSKLNEIDIETAAKWEGPQLVVERKIDGGMTIVNQYSRFDNPKQLVVITRIEHAKSQDKAPAFTRVYEPADQ